MTQGFIPLPVMRSVVRRGVKPILTPERSWSTQRRALDLLLGGLVRSPRGNTRTRGTLAGRPVEVHTPAGMREGAAVLYLHGGGYTVGSPATHRALCAHLAASSRAAVHALDYRRAPEHPYPAGLQDALDAYTALAAETGGAVAIAGDSAGAGLALTAERRLRSVGAPAPAGLALICPWLDLDQPRSGRDDVLLDPRWIAACAAAYRSAGDPVAADLDLLGGDLAGLPPLLVQVAQHDLIIEDGRRLADAARSAGSEVVLEELPNLWHVAHLSAGLVRASTDATWSAGRFLGRCFER